jgi:hypothetical protein
MWFKDLKEKRPVRRPCDTWQESINVDLRGTGCEGGSWYDLMVGFHELGSEPSDAIKAGDFLASWVTVLTF